MKKYAVAVYTDFDLQIKIVEASSWQVALMVTFGKVFYVNDTLEKAKKEASKDNWYFDVKEVK